MKYLNTLKVVLLKALIFVKVFIFSGLIKIMGNKIQLFPSRTFQIKHHGNYFTGDIKPFITQKGDRQTSKSLQLP